ncbi:hypothetical protein FHR70_004445 [Microvirga lupini]|uniref:DUF1236 domain-containing protein n=1 Tax=Microvirga lupini TaxID=420324 RepID=A0A7W4YZJ5_9HYPH|nr:hypothetical protein [Microvirga lupini]
MTTSKPKAVTVPSSVTISKGTVLPETVEITPFLSDVGVTEYRYAVVGNQTVLVEPSSRSIIERID